VPPVRAGGNYLGIPTAAVPRNKLNQKKKRRRAMSQTPQVDVNALWRYVVAQVKTQTSLPALWRSMEAAHPIALEEEELVVGYSGAEAHLKGLLTDVRNRNLVEQILLAASRRRIRLRIIEGETQADWEAIKQADAEAVRMQQQSRQQYQQQVQAGTTWEAVGEQVIRKLNEQPQRALASVQGRFLDGALDVVADAYVRLMPAEPAELDERTYSRTLNRICDHMGIPAAIVAYLVHQRVEARKAGGG
jgi:hypothetical protein